MLGDYSVGAAIALFVSLIVCRAVMRAGPLDAPTLPRKGHGAPTPTSGGIGIASGFAAGLLTLSLFSTHWSDEVSAEGAQMLSFGGAIAYGFLGLGFFDDARPLRAGLKFVIFAVLSLLAAWGVGVVDVLPLGRDVVLDVGPWVGLIGTALWVFTMVNCVNFMDGVNGLAMGACAIGLVVMGAIAWIHPAPSAAGVALCGAGALAGFLFWNFPRGRLFAGDSGALFAGALGALVSLMLIHRVGLSPFVPAIVFFPLLADALLTLAWRASRGRSLLEGHSEHLYQIARRAGWSHKRVALAYWLAMAVSGAIAVATVLSGDPAAAPLALAFMSAAALLVSTLVRRAAAKRGIAEI